MDEKMEEALKSFMDNLTDKQKEKAKNCEDWDELIAYLGKEGFEIPDEVAGLAAGGVQAGDIINWEVVREQERKNRPPIKPPRVYL